VQIQLINAAHLMGEVMHKSKFDQDDVIQWLAPHEDITFFTIGKGKGGRVMVTAETAETIRKMDWPVLGKGKAKKKGAKEALESQGPTQTTTKVIGLDPKYKEVLDGLDAWKTDVESVVLDNDARTDELYKLFAQTREVYIQLRSRVDSSANLPEAPPLPPRYKRKVLMVGLDTPSVTRLRDNFRDIEIVHLGGERNMPTVARNRTLGRDYEFILCMTSYCSHSLREAVEKRFGKDKIQYLKGSQSAAEGAISVWRHERQQDDTERLAQ
jgi:hypothetical protein